MSSGRARSPCDTDPRELRLDARLVPVFLVGSPLRQAGAIVRTGVPVYDPDSCVLLAVGFAHTRGQLWDERDWSHLDLEPGEVVLVVAATDGSDDIAEILRRNGGGPVDPVHPA